VPQQCRHKHDPGPAASQTVSIFFHHSSRQRRNQRSRDKDVSSSQSAAARGMTVIISDVPEKGLQACWTVTCRKVRCQSPRKKTAPWRKRARNRESGKRVSSHFDVKLTDEFNFRQDATMNILRVLLPNLHDAKLCCIAGSE